MPGNIYKDIEMNNVTILIQYSQTIFPSDIVANTTEKLCNCLTSYLASSGRSLAVWTER